MKEPGLKCLDSRLCISIGVREHLENLSWRKGSSSGGGLKKINGRGSGDVDTLTKGTSYMAMSGG